MSSDADSSNSVRLIGFLAGTCSGLTKLAVGHPFDTIKTRMQCVPIGTYKGATDCFLTTIRREGPLALYKGASPPAVGWAITDSVLLGSLHNYRILLLSHGFAETTPSLTVEEKDEKRLSLLGHAVAGIGAGWTNAVFAHPIELLKGKLQLQLAAANTHHSSRTNHASTTSPKPPVVQFSGPIDCARQVVREQGFQGLWRGFGATLAFRSNFAFMFGGYELNMRLFSLLDNTPYALSIPTQTFIAGGMGANAFWLGALPADNVKNRMMTDSITKPRYTGVLSVVRAIYAEAGFKGFYRGFVPVVLRAFPTNASALFVFESVMRWSGAEKTRG
ncbi:Mitochondrial carnitine-acylcarnitine carrier protein [Phaffia rhodozyma]|uniref:Mitochondrial carnitine-acylcarnitine carrier protein n=1 Tax=Phaffia rhodozyma TaxID=264483 RepID=A0A0F7SN59_PHARH|nr:Mitochondrial carnitine-acylcarnitine carrier protein [Phaffia rhodozyma]